MSKQTPGSGSLKDLEIKRREVFKPILDNPYTRGNSWPQVPDTVSKSILEYLTQLLSSYGQYNQLRKTSKDKNIPKHDLENKITIGFNSTVRVLEEQAAPNREKVLKRKGRQAPITSTKPYVKYVFVAKSDITTPLLTNSLPLLAFSASRSLQDRVKLIELPRGSLEKLLKVLKEDRVSIMSLRQDWAEGAPLFTLIDDKIKDVEVPWLEALFTGDGALDAVYQKPDVRFLKTSAPIGKPKNQQKKQKKQKRDGEGEEKDEKEENSKKQKTN
ncbi:CIC11C00000005751 [Sungouiella intermedia]|uniref:CIC11C00000005751 n=1 Tax=Sungouiella intermedia TaxID=45354 RepID=A0A1L0DNJ6_9ASCO|nr:CIC11C00000005751 [[Candida] intermedia]